MRFPSSPPPSSPHSSTSLRPFCCSATCRILTPDLVWSPTWWWAQVRSLGGCFRLTVLYLPATICGVIFGRTCMRKESTLRPRLRGALIVGLLPFLTWARPAGKATEKFLGPVPALVGQIVRSRDLRHAAGVVAVDSGQSAWFDGKVQAGIYDSIWIGELAFSPDGQHTLYIAMKGGKAFAVIDGRPGPVCDEIELGDQIFSPDSRRTGYAARDSSWQWMVIDGVAGPRGYGAWGLIFSPDSRRAAYILWQRGARRVVIDGRVGPEYTSVRELVFSPDSRRLAFSAEQDEAKFIVVDSVPGPAYDALGREGAVFSPDGRSFAYSARRGDKWFVVQDTAPGSAYDEITDGPVFSPDSRRMAYCARRGEQYRVVVDGREGPEYADAHYLVFSPDSRSLAYRARQGDKVFTVRDGVPGPAYDGVEPAVFSPDSRRMAVLAWQNDRTRVIDDSLPGAEYYDIRDESVIFSPDSRHLAYCANDSVDRWFAVLDGKPGTVYNDAARPVFSPDSRRFAFRAGRGYRALVVVDGLPGAEYDRLLGGPEFRADGALEWLAVRSDSLFRVRLPPGR
ncbi:hypothetical protein FJY68_01255 [candidate division WOR-3 bacterium]|uniref:Dipeptidylpeptidase IV N-terminal domain-containing protein n=1 Tax=candidate division WOR-3 bacterium TaxID=2052148 RepID=A0A937XG47_UNCW3|nr:hypothetical protein [candidate division WOR-3 bacterium]